MKPVFWISDCATTPLAATSEANFTAVQKGKSSIKAEASLATSEKPFFASLFSEEDLVAIVRKSLTVEPSLTIFEALCVYSLRSAISKSGIDFSAQKTVFILSSTKGNIELINTPDERLNLYTTAKRILAGTEISSDILVVSNACVSGVSALITAQRLLTNGCYDHAIICGADRVTSFVASGFQSLYATADSICKPYDVSRNGINLGEAAATVILSTVTESDILVGNGSVANDANHISGPSRTGAELAQSVKNTLIKNKVKPTEIAFISAHGTATVYNDEMESKAFALADLSEIPLQSLKPHFGHTLGAAGVLESVISVHALREGIVLPSLNYEKTGVSGAIFVNTEVLFSTRKYALKTASGFGGVNAAILFSKTN